MQLQRFGRLGRIDVAALREPLAFLLPPAPGEEEPSLETAPDPEGERAAPSVPTEPPESPSGDAALPGDAVATG